MCLYHVFMDFLGCRIFILQIITARASVLSFFQICRTTLHFCMGLTKTEICISFSSCRRSGSVLPQQKCSAMAVLCGRGLELFV